MTYNNRNFMGIDPNTPSYNPFIPNGSEIANRAVFKRVGQSLNKAGRVSCDTFSPRTTNMNSIDMHQKYLNNDASLLTLEQIGVQNEIQRLVKTPNEMGKTNGRSIHSDFLQQIQNGRTHFENTYKPRSVWSNFCDPLWGLGGITVSGDFVGGIKQVGNRHYIDGQINYFVKDRFTAPYDTWNLMKEEWNPDGTPYLIQGSWSEPVYQEIPELPPTEERRWGLLGE